MTMVQLTLFLSNLGIQGFRSFALAEVVTATNNFSPDNKIGAGSFGVVYKGNLANGSEVAIKRREPAVIRNTKFSLQLELKDRACRPSPQNNNEHLVRLIWLCEEKDERVLVYEYMKNRSLYDHLHNVEKGSSVLSSWKMRIQIALDAAREIANLHNYYLHGDIKSSNILLDANWIARVSDFGLKFAMGTAGTDGYIDPECYMQNNFTEYSDLYAFGVVLLELLTGKKAIFNHGGIQTRVVDFAVPFILDGELGEILDPRVGPPDLKNEAYALKLVAFVVRHCLYSESKYRPITMADVVSGLPNEHPWEKNVNRVWLFNCGFCVCCCV